LAPAPAHAAAALARDPIVVYDGGARAVVQRVPFRQAFTTPGGRTVLREVRGGRRPRAVALPPTRDPEPFALEDEPDHAVYAPLTFEVGREALDQWTGSYWTGNLLQATRAGTVHRATRVLRATRAGAGVRLVLATTDGRRRLVVRIGPDRGAALRVRARPVPARGVMAMADSFATAPGEAFHGFGGRHRGVDQRGRKLYGWVEQENLGGPTIARSQALLPAFALQGTGRTLAQIGVAGLTLAAAPGGARHYLFPGGPGGAYYPQALFVSSRPYGFLLNQPQLVRWRMADDRPDAWQAHVSARRLDYTVAVGRAPSAIRTLTAIGGRHRLPARWAQGPSLLRAVRNDGTETREAYRAKVERDLADIARRRPPLGSYAFEGWGFLGDPAYVRSVVRRLHRLGIRALLYTRAYVAGDILRTQPAGDFERVTRDGLVATDARGRPYVFDVTGGRGVLLDPTKAAARRWWRARIELMLRLGADGFMDDFGEQVLAGMRFHDGSTGARMHNRYPVLLHRLTDRVLTGWARRHPRRGRPWSYTRSGYSGRPGSPAYEQGTFAGDATVDWGPASGLRSQAPDMLNRAIGGAYGFTTDIGGYVSLVTGPTGAELFTRWAQWSALTPYFRVHNSSAHDTRTPWSFGARTYARWLSMARLHERALPYIRRVWRAARRTGMPVTRPL
ncbi:MAG TPA: TIM-barrel domain-containing protein, partial [Solirubrobacteraceae bacterium]|nr:TIM-barrel domain-containing protein [Solirubrobacteraceae bacterium]